MRSIIFTILMLAPLTFVACSDSSEPISSGKTMKELGLIGEKDVPEGTKNDTYDINSTHEMWHGNVIKKPTKLR